MIAAAVIISSLGAVAAAAVDKAPSTTERITGVQIPGNGFGGAGFGGAGTGGGGSITGGFGGFGGAVSPGN